MSENDVENILVMALFVVTRDYVLACANELGIPEEQITDDVIELVKERISQGIGGWREVVKGMIKETIKEEDIKCSLGLVCSPSCAFREVGECTLPGGVK